MLYELTSDSRIGVYHKEGLAVCRRCFSLRKPYGVYKPDRGAGVKTQQRLYICQKCLPAGCEKLDITHEFKLLVNAIDKSGEMDLDEVIGEGTTDYVRRQIKQNGGTPVKTRELIHNGQGHGKDAVQMALFYLCKRGEIKRVAHGQYVAKGVEPTVIRSAGDIDIKDEIYKALLDAPGLTAIEIQEKVKETCGHKFCLRTIRLHSNDLIDQCLIYREREAPHQKGSYSYQFYAIPLDGEEAC